jgi:hypothetical protein
MLALDGQAASRDTCDEDIAARFVNAKRWDLKVRR